MAGAGAASAREMRILLTGASGFVGHHALSSLSAAGAEVHAVSRQRQSPDMGVRWHLADLLKPGTPAKLVDEVRPDCVLHLAWTVEHGVFWTDPTNLEWSAATLSLAAAATKAGVRRFVGVGTCYEYEWPENASCDERRTPLASHTLYDTSKDACRRTMEVHFAAAKMSFAWARLFFLYGPAEGPDRLVSSIARNLVAEKPAACSRGRAVRDFMDVRDAGAALAAIALSDVEGAINVGTGQGYPVSAVASSLGELAGRPDLVRIGDLPDRIGEPPFIVASVERLNREVGFETSRSLKEGLADALAFWNAQIENGRSL